MRSVVISLLLLTLCFFVFYSCSNNPETPTGSGDEPPLQVDTILVTPSTGVPGNMIEISGYTIDPSDTTISIYVGDEPTVFLSDSSSIHAMIPLFYDSTIGWSSPPPEAQDVTIRKNDSVVALADAALSINALPHAEGATDSILQDLQIMSASMHSIYDALGNSPQSDPRLPAYRSAILMMLDSILVGTDSSIASIIGGTSTWSNGQQVDVALIDAILESSGTLDFYNDVASSLGQLNNAIQGAQSKGLLCKDGGEDIDLACEMQIYVVLDNYANYFVKPTTTTYAHTVGLTAGLLAISGVGIGAEAIIGALLTVFDFVYGTLAPSLFPAEITQFSLDVQTDSIAVDEMTSTTLQISATNHPATITATQILDQLLSALGFAKASQVAESFREVLRDAMSHALDLYRKAIVEANTNSGGEIFIDPEADLPSLNWGPIEITSSDLVELFSFTENIIIADTANFEWKGVSRGEGRIQARARGAGERSKVLMDNTLCWGCIYDGGAFGENAPGSETQTVIVGKKASLLVQINGLPNGTDASVIVSGTDYSSGTITATQTLENLEPGDYTITAVEVRDANNDKYIPTPIDTSVTLSDDDFQTVTITYEPEYGSLLLTVAGLPDGIDGDITVSGDGISHWVYCDTLIDSLPPGIYTINANNVKDTDGVTDLIPSPQSQDVEVIGAQTAIASIEYNAESTINFYVGAESSQLEYFAEANRPIATTQCGSSSDGQSYDADSLFLPDLSYNQDCNMEGGNDISNGSYSFSASCSSGSASGSASITFTYNAISQEITVNGSVSINAAAPSPTDSTPFASYGASSNVGFDCPILINIINPTGKNLAFIITYTATASRYADLGVGAGASFNCGLVGISGYNCNTPLSGGSWFSPSFTPPEDTLSSVDTVTIQQQQLAHLRIFMTGGGSASGLTYTDQNGDAAQMLSGNASGTLTATIRFVELP